MTQLEYERVRWGITACSTEGCRGDAELLLDVLGARCIRCADDYLERLRAAAILGRPLEYDWFVFDDGEAGVA